jgi:hypothetical protein
MELREWLDTLSAAIGTDDLTVSNDIVHTVLDLARDSAHEVERVAAPLTTFLVGVAVGRGQPLGTVAAEATRLLIGDATHGEDELPDDN